MALASLLSDKILSDAYEIYTDVINNIVGRSADVSKLAINTCIAAGLSVVGGEGDFLEIGSYFGASSITIARMMKKYNVDGSVVCLDPLDGRLQRSGKQTIGDTFDLKSQEHYGKEMLESNARKNNVILEIIAEPSYMLPSLDFEKKFKCVYIDGDHWHDAPTIDFLNVRRMAKCVIFDDADEAHPCVMDAIRIAKDFGWDVTKVVSTLTVMEKLL